MKGSRFSDRTSPDLPLTDAARGAFTRALQRYGPDAPELTVAKLIEENAQLFIRLDGDRVAPWEVDERSSKARR